MDRCDTQVADPAIQVGLRNGKFADAFVSRVLAISGGSGHAAGTSALPREPTRKIRTSAFSGFRRLYPQVRTLRMVAWFVRRWPNSDIQARLSKLVYTGVQSIPYRHKRPACRFIEHNHPVDGTIASRSIRVLGLSVGLWDMRACCDQHRRHGVVAGYEREPGVPENRMGFAGVKAKLFVTLSSIFFAAATS